MTENTSIIETLALPEWVNETPEHTEERLYILTTYPDVDLADQQVDDLTREEFIWLKECLAERRGLVHGPAGLDSLAKGATDEFILQKMHTVVGNLQERVGRVLRMRMDSSYITTLLAEVSILEQIVVEWDGGNWDDKYPDELGLVASIRGNLGL